MADDHYLSQVKVVEILRSTLSNGILSTSELDDLQMVADNSRSIMPRSKTMLDLFVKKAKKNIEKIGPYKLPTSGHIYAANLACDFLRRLGRGHWPNLDRDEVGVGTLMRIAYPSLVDQGGGNLCGPAAMLYNLLRDRPGAYARYAIDLYERGEAKMVDLSIKPGDGVRFHSPPSEKVDPIDWLTAASLRDSENWFYDYDMANNDWEGATTPMELAYWFHRAGYSDIKEDANFVWLLDLHL